MIPCKLDLTSTPLRDETIITYEIESSTSGKKIGFNLLDDKDFTIPYINDTIPDSPAGHGLPSQANRNMFIIAINEEEPITSQGVLDKLNLHQTPQGKSKIKNYFMQKKELPKNRS